MNVGLIKSGIQLISGFGVGLIVDEAIKIVKPKNLVGLKKIAVKVGAFTISAMAADKASEYVEDVWDKTVNDVKNFTMKPEGFTEEVEAE